jgi:prepilin-type N-terminal cleavage/methylation domain-containing protein
MSRRISFKRAFTLVEIVIVVIIISIVYYFSISNFNVKLSKPQDNLSLINLKNHLLKYEFQDNITIKCVDNGKLCYILIDGAITKHQIKDLFKIRPEVYSYNKQLDMLEFADLEMEKLESFEVCFEYSIDKYLKSSDIIVQTNDKVYIFNSIHNKPIVLDYLSDVDVYFDDKQQELKDAF